MQIFRLLRVTSIIAVSVRKNDFAVCFSDISESNSLQSRMAKRKQDTSELDKIDEHCENTFDAGITNSAAKKIKSNSEEQNDEEMKQPPLKLWISLAEDAIGKNIVQIAVNSSKFVGAHVSIASGIHLAPRRAAESGCRSFALFLSSARQWRMNELKEETAKKFRQNCLDFGYSAEHIVPHGSYLLNIGSPNTETIQKSRDMLLHEVRCCEKLGLSLYNFHPGSTCGRMSVEDCIKKIVDALNSVINETKNVTILLETMAGQGNTIGSFDDLKEIINQVEDKTRIGVCLDTCHVFANGHDISNRAGYEKMMQQFESKIGLQYLKAIHLNDSKDKCGSHKDRHENIGNGQIGLNGFDFVMNDPRLDNLPLILETPLTLTDAEEIRILYNTLKS